MQHWSVEPQYSLLTQGEGDTHLCRSTKPASW